MLIIVVLLATLVVGLATAFLGLAYHHERRHHERHHGLAETSGSHLR
jgi:Flp pilus assembly protein TadB